MMKPISFFIALALPSLCVASPEQDLIEGMWLYNELEYQAAIEKLTVVKNATELDRHKRAKAALYIGVSELALSQTDAARRSFAEALALDPSIDVPESESPKIRTLFRETRTVIEAQRATSAGPADDGGGGDPLIPMTTAGFATAGVGALTLIGGAVVTTLAIIFQRQRDTFTTEVGGAIVVTDPNAYSEADGRARIAAVVGAITLGVGTLATVGGGTLGVLGLAGRRADSEAEEGQAD